MREKAGEGGENQQRVQVNRACEVIDEILADPTDSSDTSWRRFCDESLVDAAESGDLAFPFGNFSVSRSCRPFFASHASEQLSLVLWLSVFMEGPLNFRSKFSGCCRAQSERAQK